MAVKQKMKSMRKPHGFLTTPRNRPGNKGATTHSKAKGLPKRGATHG